MLSYAFFSPLPDARMRRMTMRGIGAITAPFLYNPFLGSVGSKSSYFPGDVSQDARALNFLGFLSDIDLEALKPSSGTQSGDMNGERGAWDPFFRGAMTRYQAARSLTKDSWIGPQSRGRMKQDVDAKNAATPPGTPIAPVPPLPPVPVPVNPGAVPAKPTPLPGIQPASASDDDGPSTGLIVGGVIAGVAVLGGLAWLVLSD